eukprot:TRINITY_DN1710_c0_g1_i1.p1 TRINITY_DN1710_c0_g1~~TRINITY_DN1710_c0_g1_i1.p1  ORF type:complete len:373 (+),score=66.43 TRINITY_DN1710_c0_g1_i1:91-1209(+)
MVSASIVGYIGAGVATVFFGSNYVPMKGYNTGNGIAFQWIMCSGIMILGFLSFSMAKHFVFDWHALLGGGAWALGNCMSMPTIELLGLGVGLLTWSSTNLVAGYFWGRFGVFGLKKEVITNQYFSIFGVICAVIALLLFVFIESDLPEEEPQNKKTYQTIDTEAPVSTRSRTFNATSESESESDSLLANSSPSINQHNSKNLQNTNAFYAKIEGILFNDANKRILGLAMAVISGLLYSVSLVPFQLWYEKQKSPGTFDYLFSQFGGIYVTSTIIFALYCLIVRVPSINVKATIPSYMCGLLWAVAAGGWMAATADLGFTVGYPITGVGPIIVTSLWSVFYFREIKGKKNLGLLAAAFTFIGIAVAFLVLSKQ